MQIKLTHTIVVETTLDTNSAGYKKPNDLAACIEEETLWCNAGTISTEHLLVYADGAKVTVTGEAL